MYFKTWSGTSFSDYGFYVFFAQSTQKITIKWEVMSFQTPYYIYKTARFLWNLIYEVLPKSSQIHLPKLNHLSKFVFATISFEVAPFCVYIVIPAGSLWLEGGHFVSASSSHPVIWPGSLQCSQNIAPWASILLSERRKNHRGARSGE
jgi:hypothetical protein